jgi:hypothetical protein
MHQFLKCILGMKLYMFRTVPLSIIRSVSLYTQQCYMSYNFADSLWTVQCNFQNLTFMWPCIMINSYNKTNQMHQFLKCILGMKLYMFRTVPLSIIRSVSLYTQQCYMSYNFADSLWTVQCNLQNLTFMWPCIMINSYNKTNQMHQFLKCILEMKLYMFRTVPLSIIRSSSPYTHSNVICHTGFLDSLLWHIPLLCVQWRTADVQKNCPKHVEFHSKNKFEKLVHLVGFIVRINYVRFNSAAELVRQNYVRRGRKRSRLIVEKGRCTHTVQSFPQRIARDVCLMRIKFQHCGFTCFGLL